MNVLVVAIHYPVCSARYAVDALRRLGHEVRSAGTHDRARHLGHPGR